MRNVTGRRSDPFDLRPPCERYVSGYGDANADFHVIGDHPGVHGGGTSGYPFTETPAAERLQRALAEAGLLAETGTPPVVDDAYLSYLYPCVSDDPPGEDDYADLEPTFDAEFRAITAHVLLPVGERATRHVFEIATARNADAIDLDAQHATEVHGSGWLVYPVKEPAEWTDDDESALVESLRDLRARDYRREADLGRFLPGGDTYLVR